MSIVVSVEVVTEDSGTLEVIEAFKGIETNRERVINGKQILYELPDSCTLILREVPALSEVEHYPGAVRHGELRADGGRFADAVQQVISKMDLPEIAFRLRELIMEDVAETGVRPGVNLHDVLDAHVVLSDVKNRASIYADMASFFDQLSKALALKVVP